AFVVGIGAVGEVHAAALAPAHVAGGAAPAAGVGAADAVDAVPARADRRLATGRAGGARARPHAGTVVAELGALTLGLGDAGDAASHPVADLAAGVAAGGFGRRVRHAAGARLAGAEGAGGVLSRAMLRGVAVALAATLASRPGVVLGL